MRNFLTLLALLLPVSTMAEQFDLVCTVSAVSGSTSPPQDTILHVDTDLSIVNGRNAKITASEIVFEPGRFDDRPFVTVVNRYTGSIEISLSGPPEPRYPNYRGKCVKPTQRQF